MSGTSRRRIKIAKCKLGPWYNVADIFSAPLNRRMNVECIMHLTLVELLHLRRHHQLFGYIHSPQMTSRYVIFGQLF